MDEPVYAGFWIRSLATIIDSVLLLAIILPVLTYVYGVQYWIDGVLIHGFWDVLLNYILPVIAVIVFWQFKSATPGKLVLGLSIVDASTGGKPRLKQFIIRYFAYLAAILPLFLGMLWIAFDKRKQGWHDKLAGTVVIRR